MRVFSEGVGPPRFSIVMRRVGILLLTGLLLAGATFGTASGHGKLLLEPKEGDAQLRSRKSLLRRACGKSGWPKGEAAHTVKPNVPAPTVSTSTPNSGQVGAALQQTGSSVAQTGSASGAEDSKKPNCAKQGWPGPKKGASGEASTAMLTVEAVETGSSVAQTTATEQLKVGCGKAGWGPGKTKGADDPKTDGASEEDPFAKAAVEGIKPEK